MESGERSPLFPLPSHPAAPAPVIISTRPEAPVETQAGEKGEQIRISDGKFPACHSEGPKAPKNPRIA
jgi:hypothetical protein